MDKINGVSFEDWAAACAHIAAGMSGEEVCEILGIEDPVWDDTNNKWVANLGSLPGDAIMKYSEIFQNPKVGKFANLDVVADIEDTLKIVPDYDTYIKISAHQSAAATVGLDPGEIISSYGLSVQQWGQMNVHWCKWVQENINEKKCPEAIAELGAHNKWSEYWEEYYKDAEVDLADDIDF